MCYAKDGAMKHVNMYNSCVNLAKLSTKKLRNRWIRSKSTKKENRRKAAKV